MAGGEDRGAGRSDQNAPARSADADGLAVGAERLTGRAQVIAEILRLSETAEPGARISLRLVMGDPEDIESQQDGRFSLLRLVPGETWILTASDVVLDAVEEAFGFERDELSAEGRQPIIGSVLTGWVRAMPGGSSAPMGCIFTRLSCLIVQGPCAGPAMSCRGRRSA